MSVQLTGQNAGCESNGVVGKRAGKAMHGRRALDAQRIGLYIFSDTGRGRRVKEGIGHIFSRLTTYQLFLVTFLTISKIGLSLI